MCRLVIQGGKARYRDLDLNRALCEELLILDLRRGPEAIAHNPPIALIRQVGIWKRTGSFPATFSAGLAFDLERKGECDDAASTVQELLRTREVSLMFHFHSLSIFWLIVSNFLCWTRV